MTIYDGETPRLPSISTSECVKLKEPSETTRLLDMANDKKAVTTDAGLCNFWAVVWLTSWYIFSGARF